MSEILIDGATSAALQQYPFLKRGLSRRSFLKGAGGSALALTFASLELACQPNRPRTEPTKTPPTRILPVQPDDLEIPNHLDAIERHYPELIGSGLTVQETHRITMEDGLDTQIYNFSEYRVNPQVAEAIYGYYELLAGLYRNRDSRAIITHPYNGRNHQFVALPIKEIYSRSTLRTSVIVPENTPNFSGAFGRPAATKMEGSDIFAFVKTTRFSAEMFDTVEKGTTLSFAVEACNQTLASLIYDPQSGAVLSSDRDTILAQEIVGNSLGRAVAARVIGVSYADYFRYATTARANIGDNRSDLGSANLRFSYIVVGEPDYNSIPQAGTIIQ